MSVYLSIYLSVYLSVSLMYLFGFVCLFKIRAFFLNTRTSSSRATVSITLVKTQYKINIPIRDTERQTDRQTDRDRDKQTDRDGGWGAVRN